jgi:hypothetical protein
MKLKPEAGDRIRARMYDSRLVEGIVSPPGVFDTTSGARLRFQSGEAVYLIRADQVLKVSRRRFDVFLRESTSSKKWYVSRRIPFADAQAIVANYNVSHSGVKKAEFEEAR